MGEHAVVAPPDGPRWLQRLVAPSSLPTTRARLFWNIALLMAGMRVVTLLQMAPSLGAAVRASEAPDLVWVSWVLALVGGIGIVTVVLARLSVPPVWWVVTDVALLLVNFVIGMESVDQTERVGTWIGYQPALALSVLVSAALVPSWRLWGVLVGAVLVADYFFIAEDPTSGGTPTVIGNLLTLALLPLLIRLGLRYGARIADVADESAARAAELARREEERRAHVAMHNGAAVMALLARDDLSPAVRDAVREQALEETARMRRYLLGAARETADDQSLVAVVDRTCDAFPDLQIHDNTDLGAHVQIPEPTADAVGAALTSVLLNVRQHARSSQVVVHLDEVDGRWILSVHDDGRGFDVAGTPEGVGIREVVRAQLETHGISTQVESVLGAGTTVTMTGRCPQATEAEADAIEAQVKGVTS